MKSNQRSVDSDRKANYIDPCKPMYISLLQSTKRLNNEYKRTQTNTRASENNARCAFNILVTSEDACMAYCAGDGLKRRPLNQKRDSAVDHVYNIKIL